MIGPVLYAGQKRTSLKRNRVERMGQREWGMGLSAWRNFRLTLRYALCALRYAKNKGGCYERGSKDLFSTGT